MPSLLARTVFLGLLALPSLVRAQELPVIAPDQPLSLADCIALALKKNYALQIQDYSTAQAKESVEVAQGAFDPAFNASFTRSLTQAASNVSVLEGEQTSGPRNDNTTMSVGLSQRLAPTNGTLSVSTNVTRTATNSTIARLNPNFGNGVSVNLSQPLLQNAGRKVALAPLERAKLGLGISRLTFRSTVLSTIASVEIAYYNLVSAREAVRIRQLSLDLAQILYDENLSRRSAGTMTNLDVLTAESGVANARGAVLQAEKSARDAEDTLLQLVAAADLDLRPGPVKFDEFTDGPPNFARSYKLARDYYPDTLSAEQTLKQLQITLDVARRNQLPTLNLIGSLGYTARAVSTGYADVIANLTNEHGNNWSLGLTYSAPWGRRADRANYRSARAGVESQKVRVDQLELQLLAAVRAAVRTVETNLAAVAIAVKAAELSARQYELQKALYDAGRSTARLVLQAQDDLETARFNALGAELNLRQAAATLHQLEGSSLQRYQIALP